MRKARIISVVTGLVIVTVILSFTIGRELLAGRQPGLLSFSIVNFVGYLFFLLMPVGVLVPYYIAEGHNILVIPLLAIITALIAQFIDYSIGHTVGYKIIDNLVSRKRYLKAMHYIKKYGGLTIFIFNLFPLSSPIILLAAGMLRYSLKQTMFYSFLGLAIKYIGMAIIFG